ncbi:MAG: hypothetical protein IKT67_13310 [Lachnospiraceae bacterium]|nr:hypothetical protein [Lachnospiraceae bacterium]
MAEPVFPEHLKSVRLFWGQCRSAVRYGSGRNSAESVFIKNMTELRRDVQNECYQRAQARYLFAGMGVVVALPVLFLPFVRWFGTVTLEELNGFYSGIFGRAVVCVFFLLSAGCYLLLNFVRQADKRGYTRPEFIRRFFSSTVFRPNKEAEKENKAERYGRKKLKEAGIDADGRQYWMICGIVGVIGGLIVAILLYDVPVMMKTVTCIGGVFAGMGVMMFFYKYLAYLRKLGIKSEVMSLQAVILLLIDVPNITLTEILDVLGNCSELFQNRLSRCADEYAADDVVALEQLAEEDDMQELRQLTGRMIAAERVGLQTAFEEVAADRLFFREQLRLDSEYEQKKKAANAQVIAFLPMMFLLFAYLILPFLGASLVQMREIFAEMEQIRL